MDVPQTTAFDGWRKRLAIAVLVIFALTAGATELVQAGWLGAKTVTSRSVIRVPLKPLTPVPQATLSPLAAPDIAPDEARLLNAKLPFSIQPNQPARPYVFEGSPIERESALTCLASALWYEAGDDAVGQMAVAQVVLNRVRHPAFAKTICGVVFEGSERKTGCQFTFTCDGALSRTPSGEAWKRAREAASQAISGYVFKPVGTATHYHTDWVIPYWAPTLDKITIIHTHIFYRWRGWWGLLAAFNSKPSSAERIHPRIARLAQTDGLPLMQVDALALKQAEMPVVERVQVQIPGLGDAELKGSKVYLADLDQGTFALHLNSAAYPGSYAIAANSICKGRSRCTVVGWLKAASIPTTLPILPSNMVTSTFVYRRNKEAGVEKAMWNCQAVKREDSSQCRPGTEPSAALNTAPETAPGR